MLESQSVIWCSECDMPHHRECWNANGGCTTYGCGGHPVSENERIVLAPSGNSEMIIDSGCTGDAGGAEIILDDDPIDLTGIGSVDTTPRRSSGRRETGKKPNVKLGVTAGALTMVIATVVLYITAGASGIVYGIILGILAGILAVVISAY